jgi:hypothetical protein
VVLPRALARDLADAHGSRARPLLEAAAQEAIAHLDASTLEARDLAASLRRLAAIRTRARAALDSIAFSAQPV